MRKKPWLRLIAVIATAGILSSASSVFAQGLPQQPAGLADTTTSQEAAPAYQQWQELPQNIQSLMPQLEQKDVVVPSDNPYELTVKHPDNTYTTEVYAVPVKYQDSQGEMQYVDTSMQKPSLLKRMFSSQAYTNKEGYVALTYPTEISKGVQVDKAFTWSVPERKQQDKVSAASTEPDGSGKVMYPGAFGESTYVEYTNTYAGFKENIVLEKNIGQNTFDFVFESDEYMPVLVDGNRAIEIVLKSDPGQSKYTISPLYVYDSFDPTTSDDPYSHKHWTDDCHYEIIPQQEGRYIIRAVVSEDFLNHPETVYPVTIDPSVNANAAASNVEDGFVKESDKKGYGKYDYLQFGYLNGKIYSYVKFINLPKIPAGAYFTSANFKVTFRTGQNTPANMKATVKDCNKDFDESTLNWNNRPFGKTAQSSVLPKITNGYLDYYSFSVIGVVRDWYTKYTNYGLVFDYQNETYSDYNSVVSSEGDAARAPRMTFYYGVPDAPTSGITNDGYYFIRNRGTGKYLSIPGDYLYVDQESYKGTANQLWKVHYNGDGSYAISSPARSGYYLYAGADIDKGTVSLLYETGTLPDDCRFLIVPNSAGNFRLTSRFISAFFALTAGRTDSTIVEAYTYTGALDQQWFLDKYALSLSASGSEVVVGKTLRINPSTTALPLTWSTSDSKVATVSGGLVYARTPGTVTITATASNGVKATFKVTVRDPDPFHPSNIEYMRIKKYEPSAFSEDGDITTIVVKSAIESAEYFECYAPEWDNMSLKVDQELIDALEEIEREYPHAILALAPFHHAKTMVDEMVESKVIESGSTEYYGLWVRYALLFEEYEQQITGALQLTTAAITAAYNTYKLVSAAKVAQASVNTTQTYNAASYRAVAEDIDDMFAELSKNNVKYTKENTMWITRNLDGKVCWLETGTTESGFQHIMMRHPLSEFADLGVTSERDVSSLIYKVVTNQSSVGKYKADGTVYSCGGQKYLNVIIGSNGYVVSAHNVSKDIKNIKFY